MPVYEWECPSCGQERDVVAPVSQCYDPQTCECGAAMNKVIKSAPYGTPDITPYVAVTGDMAGKPITSRREHREFLKRNRLVELGNDIPKDTSKIRTRPDRKEIRKELRKVVPDVLKRRRG
jgi:putative FmdB family regulatory protein